MSEEKLIVRALPKQLQPTAILLGCLGTLLTIFLIGQDRADAHIRTQAIAAMAAPEQLAALDARVSQRVLAIIDGPDRSAALDQRIDQRATAIVNSPDRLALKTTMIDKHTEYERAIESLNRKTDALEHNDNDRALLLGRISSTLDQVQKDVAEIKADQRAARDSQTRTHTR
jgi:hypothetical protein